ncbi:hypothetical protein D9M68_956110 [compost metagenome]
MHIGKRDQAGFFIQHWGRVAVITEDAEVFGPGTFTHHQYRQGFSTVGLPGRIAPRVFTDSDKGLAGRRDLFTKITKRSSNVVAWHHHQTQLVVITE